MRKRCSAQWVVVVFSIIPKCTGAEPDQWLRSVSGCCSLSFRCTLGNPKTHCAGSFACGRLSRECSITWSKVAKGWLNASESEREDLPLGTSEDGCATELEETDRAESLRLWRSREAKVIYSIINCACHVKDFGLAMELLAQLIERYVGFADLRQLIEE